MTPGKASAQAGHAYVNSLLEALKQNPDIVQEYQQDGLGTKICLVSKNLKDLIFANHLAKEAGLPNSLIVDSGHVMPPHFDGNTIITALGIGPCTRADVGHITKGFLLL